MFALNDIGLRLTPVWNIGIRRFFFWFYDCIEHYRAVPLPQLAATLNTGVQKVMI
jgi:hypothetical protein